jgi:transposase
MSRSTRYPRKPRVSPGAQSPSIGRQVHPEAAGVDVGAREFVTAVAPERAPEGCVRTFQSFTHDIERLVQWLLACKVRTVAMESTGNYWVPLFRALEAAGIEVCLVNARHVRGVPGRKTDVCDAQWLQQLHTAGLLQKSFHPSEKVASLRYVARHRAALVQESSRHLLHQQKVLNEMNLKLHHVFSDIDGRSAMAIVEAILAGERDPAKLAALRDRRCRASQATVEKSLQGQYRPELLFVLRQAHAMWTRVREQVAEADAEYARLAAQIGEPMPKPLPPAATPAQRRLNKNSVEMDVFGEAFRFYQVDLSQVPGVGAGLLTVLMSEIGTREDLKKNFRSAEAFSSWNGLSPDNRITGGRVLKAKTRKVKGRLATAFRLAAHGLALAKGTLGDHARRMKGRLGKAEGITATAHKLARIVFGMIATAEPWDEAKAFRPTASAKANRLKRLQEQAKAIGMQLVPVQ